MVEISPEKLQLIGVQVVQAGLKPLLKTVRAVGRVEYDEKRIATINTKFEGWIEKLYVDYTGKYIRKGDPVAEIYSPELLATQKEFINVLKWSRSDTAGKGNDITALLARDAEALVGAARERLMLWDITDEQIRKIEESGRPIRTLTLYSPVDGHIVQKSVVQGMRIMSGEKLFDVADLSAIWIVADIFEYDLPFIKVGEPARITLSYLPGREFSSKIEYVYPALAAETRTAKVRFSIPNAGGQLKPQMYADIEVKVDLGRRLLLPEDAVIDTGTRQVVYVSRGQGVFEPREVAVGLRTDGMIEVTAGLKAGEKVASSANFLIDSEAKLKGIEPLHRH
jgi:Cu(I)/Ag(I) efflux system membrane fusion protein